MHCYQAADLSLCLQFAKISFSHDAAHLVKAHILLLKRRKPTPQQRCLSDKAHDSVNLFLFCSLGYHLIKVAHDEAHY